MSKTNVRCRNNCGNSIKRSMAEDSDSNWNKEDEGWVCPSCAKFAE